MACPSSHAAVTGHENSGINIDGNIVKLTLYDEPSALPELLKAEEDKYDGVVVDIENMHTDVDRFVSSLKASLSHWARQGKKGVWIKVPIEQAKLVPSAIELYEGFWYHHAERSYVMLVYWIPQTLCTFPANASHHVGITAFVFNDKGEVLGVQEKNGPYRDSGLWKLPTGVINQGEEIYDGAIREVKEETGIDSEFLEIVVLRQSHNAPFGKSNLCFVCMLKSLSSKIIVQESEISAAKWIAMDEFVRQPMFQENDFFKQMLRICVARFEKRYKGFSAFQLTSSDSSKRQSVFYCNSMDTQN